MKTLETEILIIGGGPSGSTAALYLAKTGYQITLVEKKKFPREVLCGEFLSAEVTAALRELDLYREFMNLKPNRIKKFKAINNNGRELISEFNFEAYAMKRSVFDNMLLNKAKEENINIVQPGEVLTVTKTSTGFSCEIILSSNETFHINSKFVIGAYGKQNILDKKFGRNFIDKKSQLNAVKLHLPVNLLNEYCPDEIRIYFDQGFYCGINQVNEAEVTICFLEQRISSQVSPRDKLLEVIKSNPNFNQLFTDDAIDFIKSTNIYGSGNIFFGRKELIENGIMLTGDAARVIAPLAGDGIGMAMENAKLIYESINEYGLDSDNRNFVISTYQKLFRTKFNRRLKTAKLIQSIVLNNKLNNAVFRIMTVLGVNPGKLIEQTRHTVGK